MRRNARRNPKATAKEIQAAAKEALKCFVRGTRTSGETYYYTEGEPEWVKEMIQEAHGDMFPDDWKYEFVWDALNHIVDLDDPDDGPELEADPYNAARLQWLSSNLNRAAYVDDAMEEFGEGWPDGGVMEAIGAGQLREMEEVYWSVLESLKERAKEME